MLCADPSMNRPSGYPELVCQFLRLNRHARIPLTLHVPQSRTSVELINRMKVWFCDQASRESSQASADSTGIRIFLPIRFTTRRLLLISRKSVVRPTRCATHISSIVNDRRSTLTSFSVLFRLIVSVIDDKVSSGPLLIVRVREGILLAVVTN